MHATTFALMLSAAASAVPAAPDAARREYRVRPLDPSAKDESRRYYVPSGFETWVETGESEWMFHRIDSTAQGASLAWRIAIDPATLAPRRVHKTLRAKSGRALAELSEDYTDVPGRYPAGTIHSQTLPFAVQYVDLTQGKASEYRVVSSPEYEPWTVTLTPEGEERVEVPAGTFDCVRVSVRYDTDNLPTFLRILPSFIIRKMMGDIRFWVLKEPPHHLVRFQGRLDGSVPRVQELLRVAPAATGQ